MAIKRSREEMSATDFEISSLAMANYLFLLSGGGAGQQEARAQTGRVFECKTCSRRFPSFQALGGHRASHKKPKPEAAGADVISHDDDESKSSSGNLSSSNSNNSKKAKTHECTICGVEFAIGQALGGHMRRHRAALTGSALLPAAAAAAHHDDDLALSLGSGTRTKINGDQKKCLDLNLTPLENGLLDIGMLSPIFC